MHVAGRIDCCTCWIECEWVLMGVFIYGCFTCLNNVDMTARDYLAVPFVCSLVSHMGQPMVFYICFALNVGYNYKSFSCGFNIFCKSLPTELSLLAPWYLRSPSLQIGCVVFRTSYRIGFITRLLFYGEYYYSLHLLHSLCSPNLNWLPVYCTFSPKFCLMIWVE